MLRSSVWRKNSYNTNKISQQTASTSHMPQSLGASTVITVLQVWQRFSSLLKSREFHGKADRKSLSCERLRTWQSHSADFSCSCRHMAWQNSPLGQDSTWFLDPMVGLRYASSCSDRWGIKEMQSSPLSSLVWVRSLDSGRFQIQVGVYTSAILSAIRRI